MNPPLNWIRVARAASLGLGAWVMLTLGCAPATATDAPHPHPHPPQVLPRSLGDTPSHETRRAAASEGDGHARRARTDDGLAALRASLSRPDAIVWTHAASLFGTNTVSCIDGRSEAPVLGTPGGDAGELVLSLAALEAMLEHPIDAAWVASIFDRYVDAFGRFYVHTDRHALERLGATLRGDRRFHDVAAGLGTAEQVAAFVRAPREDLEDALLAHLTAPAHLGCGHLRLMAEHPGRYGVREGLVADALRAVFRRGWRRPDLVEFAQLEGEHEERGVLEVVGEHPVHAHSLVPMVAPRVAGRALFVLHPQVMDFVRAENAWFLVEQLPPAVAARVDADALRDHIAALGARQLAATVARLAPRLPHFRVFVGGEGVRIERVLTRAETVFHRR